jgi:PilZ domain
MDSSNERRRFPRKPLIGVVDYVGADGVSCIEIINISLGGIRMSLSGAERPGNRVELSVQVKEEEGEPVHLLGQVVWARQAEPFEAGLSFLDVDPKRPPRQLVRWLGHEI